MKLPARTSDFQSEREMQEEFAERDMMAGRKRRDVHIRDVSYRLINHLLSSLFTERAWPLIYGDFRRSSITTAYLSTKVAR